MYSNQIIRIHMNNRYKDSPKRKLLFNILFALLLMGGVFAYIGFNFDLSGIFVSLFSIPAIWNILSLLAVALQYITEALCFFIILKSFGNSVGFRQTVLYTSADLLYMNISPFALGGIPAQAMYMTSDGIPPTHTGISIAMFTCLNKTAMFCSGVFAAFVIPGIFSTGNRFFAASLIYGLIVMAGIIFFCGAAMLSPEFVSAIISFSVKVLKKLRFIKNSDKFELSFKDRMKDYSACSDYIKKHPFVTVWVFLLCIVKRTAMLVPTFLIYKGLGLSGTGFAYIIAVQALLGVAYESFFLPGAIGAYETGAMALYPEMFGKDSALTAVLYVRLFTYLAVVVPAGIIVSLKHIKKAGR